MKLQIKLMKNRKKIILALLPISLLIIILLISSLGKSDDNNQLGVNSSFSYAPIAIPEDKDFTIKYFQSENTP